jgi:hypothetical protein
MRISTGMQMIGIVVATVVLLGLIAWSIYLANGMVECWSKWRRSGMDYEFSSISGCLVEIKPNEWIPDDRYRGLEE